MEENLKILEQLLTEMRIKYHFGDNNKMITISLENLCLLLLNFTKLIKEENKKMEDKELRCLTTNFLNNELDKILINYMKIYDEYYSDNSTRDAAFLKDLVESILGISAVLEVYARDRKVSSGYVEEKLEFSKSIINSVLDYYKSKED